MKSVISRIVIAMFIFAGTVTMGGINTKEVMADTIKQNFFLCEGDDVALPQNGEDWEIGLNFNNCGPNVSQSETHYETDYINVRTNRVSSDGQVISFIETKSGSGTYKLANESPFKVVLQSKTTENVYECYLYIYPKVKDITYSDEKEYLNKNTTIWMYEGDSIQTTLTAYVGDAKLEKNIFAYKAGVSSNGISVVSDSNNVRRYTINAEKEGFYSISFTALSSKNYDADINTITTGETYSENDAIMVYVRKKPIVTLPTDFYMNVNSTRDLVCSVKDAEMLTDIATSWSKDSSSVFSSTPDLYDKYKVKLTSNNMVGDGVETLLFSDDVIKNSPYHEPLEVKSNIHVIEEKTYITCNDGTNLIEKGASLTSDKTSVIINSNTIVENVTSTNSGVATATVNNNVLTINRVAPGSCEIVITTATGTEYPIKITVKAGTPTVTVKDKNTATLSWNKTFGAVSYDVYRAETGTGLYSKIGNTKSTTTTDNTSVYGKTYFYKVVAVANDANYNSTDSNVVSCARIPYAPTIAKIEESYSLYKVTLASSETYDGYIIYAGTSKNPTKQVASTNSLTATISIGDGTWYVRARAYVLVNGKQVLSDYSENYSFSKKSIKEQNEAEKNSNVNVAKTKVKKATVAGKKMKLTVKKIKGAKGYQVQVSKAKKFSKKNILVKKTVKKVKSTISSKKFISKKKLFVRVRVYTVVNGEKVWSKWSKVKKVKIV